MQMHISDPNYENFFIILLNQAMKIIKTVNISEGGVTGTIVDPKKRFLSMQ